jgi:hypothetical protein
MSPVPTGLYGFLSRGQWSTESVRKRHDAEGREPYTPGARRKPPNLAGRDRDLRALIERLGAGGYERSLIYSGLRGDSSRRA